ncbi:MAG: hypothetical protein ABIK79_02030 [Chloroflexota bacterium]
MNGSISFENDNCRGYNGRGETAATMEAAMRRCLPHIVCWDTLKKDQRALVYLPAGMDRDDLLSLAHKEQVTFATPVSARNILELHFGHLKSCEVEEGIARLGRAILSYIDGADKIPGSGPLLFVGP